MADVSANLGRLEGLLVRMGYLPKDYPVGQTYLQSLSPEFRTAFEKAQTDLTTIAKEPGEFDKAHADKLKATLITKRDEVRGSIGPKQFTTLDVLKSYSERRGTLTHSFSAIQYKLAQEGFKDNLLVPDNMKAVIQVFEDPSYIDDMRLVKIELDALPTPAAKAATTPAQPTTGSTTPSATAPAAQVATASATQPAAAPAGTQPAAAPAGTQPASAPAGTQPAAGSAQPAFVQTDAQKLAEAADNVKAMLTVMAGEIDQKAATFKQKNLMVGMLVKTERLPVPGNLTDGKFDESAQKSMHAVLKSLQDELDLTDEETYKYTPEVGKKIIRNFPNLVNSLPKEKQAQLQSLKVDDAVKNLDLLHANNMLANQPKYQSSPVQLTGMGATLLQYVFQLVGKIFPGAQSLMDDMLRQFTGGYGYNELMPKDSHVANLHDPKTAPSERTQTAYKKAMTGAIQSLNKEGIPRTLTPEESADPVKKQAAETEYKAKVKERFMSVYEAAQVIPVGTKESRAAYLAAVDKAYDESLKAAKDGNTKEQNADLAAKAFSDTVKSELTAKLGVHHLLDPKTMQPRFERIPTVVTDPTLRPDQALAYAGLYDQYLERLRSSGPKRDVFDGDPRGPMPGELKAPMVFKKDGAIWVVGVNQSNIFTVQRLDHLQDALTDLEVAGRMPSGAQRDAEVLKIRQTYPALDLMIGGYGDRFKLQDFKKAITDAPTLDQLRQAVSPEQTPQADHVNRGPRGSDAAVSQRLRQNEEDYYNRRSGVRTSNGGGIDRDAIPGMVQSNTREAMLRLDASSQPRMIDEIFKSKGHIVIQQPISRAGGHNSWNFTRIDITDEYARLDREFENFKKRNPDLKKLPPDQAYGVFAKSVDEKRYPKMAAVGDFHGRSVMSVFKSLDKHIDGLSGKEHAAYDKVVKNGRIRPLTEEYSEAAEPRRYAPRFEPNERPVVAEAPVSKTPPVLFPQSTGADGTFSNPTNQSRQAQAASPVPPVAASGNTSSLVMPDPKAFDPSSSATRMDAFREAGRSLKVLPDVLGDSTPEPKTADFSRVFSQPKF